ncbi:SGNH/GDSL hydrolase family protein [Petrimonas sp.]|uniref:SGNH/GDSL hydrolase family protein n=1 Tax=Petrimonas sp. TaxID=2023866 RepID=UPI002FC95CA9
MKVNYICILLIAVTSIYSCNTNNIETNNTKIGKVLILGNSIVAHDPAPEIGWHYDWGMAASSRDSDFVHILSSNIHEMDTSVIVLSGNLSVYENNYDTYNLEQLIDYRNFNPDMLILKISENVTYQKGMEQTFISSYNKLLKYIAPSDSTVKIIVEGFWPTPINGMIEQYAKDNNLVFVKLADLYMDDKTNTAIGLFEHEGVGRHPSDKGMRNIANRIWSQISQFFM